MCLACSGLKTRKMDADILGNLSAEDTDSAVDTDVSEGEGMDHQTVPRHEIDADLWDDVWDGSARPETQLTSKSDEAADELWTLVWQEVTRTESDVRFLTRPASA